MTILKKTLLCALMCVTGALRAQDGSLDPTFNPTDIGFAQGDGAKYGPAYTCLVQPDGKIIIGGNFLAYNNVARRGIHRVNTDGSSDATFLAGTGTLGAVNCIAQQPDGKIIIAGNFTSYNGTARNYMARLNADGTVDLSFNAAPITGGFVNSVVLQPDGKILIGGDFSTYNGIPRNKIARLNADGSLDTSFDPGTGATGGIGNPGVLAIARQTDGKILIGGDFTGYNGTARNRIARLNADGTLDTGFNPGTGTSSPIRYIVLQPDGKIIAGGDFSSYNNNGRKCIARLNTSGSLDTSFDPGTGVNAGGSGAIHSIALRPNGKLVIAGLMSTYNGSVRQRVASLNADGSLDMAFDPGAGPNQTVRGTALQPDGKVVIAGDFIYYGDRGCGRVARVNTDGSPDIGFNPGAGANGQVFCTAVQPDGKIIIGGEFTSYNGMKRNRATRLNSDGTEDAGFNLGLFDPQTVYDIEVQTDGKIILSGFSGGFSGFIHRFNTDGSSDPGFNTFGLGGTNARILSTALQPDGKIVIGGVFTSYNGSSVKCIARLNADGNLDTTFHTGTGASTTVNSVALQPDGKIIIGGGFTNYNGTACSGIGRLNANGSWDPSFDPGIGPSPGWVEAVALQTDGKIIIGGGFTSFNGTPRVRIARLNGEGSLDTGFDPGSGVDGAGATTTVRCIIPQPDGRIIIVGSFTTYDGTARNHVARLHPNGGLDATFDPGTGASLRILSTAPQPDGKIVIAGGFESYNGTGRNRVARINSTARTGIRVMLAGPYTGSTMTDALRTLPSFPLTEPFTSMGYSQPVYVPGATIPASVLSVTGNNAIVDWLLVEMRPAASPSTIAASRAVLLQRDGDVVDLDGVSTVGFAGLAAGSYCVAVRPRNHLPVMLSPSTPITYGDAIASVDFTLLGTQVYDNDARTNNGGTMVLAAGDVTFDGTVKYAGSNNDRDPILTRIGGTVPTATVSGYWREDVNMDGVVKYAGSNNDRDRILNSIGGSVPTATRVATLP